MALSNTHKANRAILSAAASAAGMTVGAYLNSDAHQAERDGLFSEATYAAMYAARIAAVAA
jgi:hypothetical protein